MAIFQDKFEATDDHRRCCIWLSRMTSSRGDEIEGNEAELNTDEVPNEETDVMAPSSSLG
jgi:hypothetical protein